ncbi:MAG: peptidyl-prolyl cis-trans isomerase [Myxococcales bacterium]|nr:peptidyl-prolyl cis-trans isomerase [Myxococcales bacterium]
MSTEELQESKRAAATTKAGRLGRFLREPLLHFALGGLALFGLDAALNPGGPQVQDSYVIEVNAARVNEIEGRFEAQHGREPTDEELDRAIHQFAEDEALYREALALGLDQGDPIVRRRMIQNMRFLTEDTAVLDEPDEDTLREFMLAHRDNYERPPRYRLEHRFFANGSGDSAEVRAQSAVADLQAGLEVTGEPFIRGGTMRHVTERDLAGIFGPEFASAAVTADGDRWQGPLRSSYGWHAVRVHLVESGHLPEVSEIRGRIANDWIESERDRINAELVGELMVRYEIRVEEGQ